MNDNDPTHAEAFRIDVGEAERLIAANMPQYGCVSVPLAEATGQILRQRIIAERDQPPFDRATMDGIAVAAADLGNGVRTFEIDGIQAAGEAVKAVKGAGHCLEVMTGAVMPTGTDTVVPVERISVADGVAAFEDGYAAEPGQFIHGCASDHSQDDVLLEPGERIGGPEMAILTAAGQANVEIARWPKVAIVSTGDELVDVGEALADFQIRSSNDRALQATLERYGCAHSKRTWLPDDPQKLLRQVGALHADNDVLVLSGGVSMGRYDYVPGILQELGVKLIFHKILQRPGLPMWFGISADNKPVFALPGNPVSTLVCFVRYVLPAIGSAMGAPPATRLRLPLAEAVDFEPDLCWFLPVALKPGTDGTPCAEPRPTNTSGDFIGLRGTDGFLALPRAESHFPVAYKADFYSW
ncbi:MAG: molybdopterin molybdotransferase MoeA [Gammaproteobacteria bacterium]|jgi:molybdopterin molybdotransferase|nr:molybdopterin molybdotransferase MoeA [Gammaproteobacteria bacterium]MDP6694049.1 molybdopterin molybdotransferase MoeA [Gammaproteobacteria bacterium]